MLNSSYFVCTLKPLKFLGYSTLIDVSALYCSQGDKILGAKAFIGPNSWFKFPGSAIKLEPLHADLNYILRVWYSSFLSGRLNYFCKLFDCFIYEYFMLLKSSRLYFFITLISLIKFLISVIIENNKKVIIFF